jgi:hypothetical protein
MEPLQVALWSPCSQTLLALVDMTVVTVDSRALWSVHARSPSGCESQVIARISFDLHPALHALVSS